MKTQTGLKERVTEAADAINARGVPRPEIAIILGTGLGALASRIEVAATLAYRDIPHFPESTVESHAGQLVFGTLSGKQVAVMEGRFHYYEGYTLEQVTFPVRVMRAAGRLSTSPPCREFARRATRCPTP